MELMMKGKWWLKLTAAVMGAGVLALPSTATATAKGYLIKVTYETYKPYDIHDCPTPSDSVSCDHLEIYGYIRARKINAQGTADSWNTRYLGALFDEKTPWDECEMDLNISGVAWGQMTELSGKIPDKTLHTTRCMKGVDDGVKYNWADTPLCTGGYDKPYPWWCYAKGMNYMILKVFPDEKINIDTNLKDYDETSPNDPICTINKTYGPYKDAELQNLNEWHTEHDWSHRGDALCDVEISVTTYGTLS
ncbi:hypothetical protein IL992_37415 [Microbispora sp. NEAU-D428]|nr:hypothetical protein [Microbispora sitophila]